MLMNNGESGFLNSNKNAQTSATSPTLNAHIFQTATAGFSRVPADWMPATALAPLMAQDGAITWLQFHGTVHGFKKDKSDYDFLGFITEKAKQFEDTWIRELAPEAVRVCEHSYEVCDSERFAQTIELMHQRCPVIIQPALWWAPAQVYGTPDIIALASWLQHNFPQLYAQAAPTQGPDHYMALDIKFTSGLDTPRKANDLQRYSAQVRIYSYILAHLQNYMPSQAFLVCRDRVLNPLPVSISSSLNHPLDSDLLLLQETFLKIKLEGHTMTPWQNELVAPNSSNDNDAPWHSAKSLIMREYIPGKDPGLLYYIGRKPKAVLGQLGFNSLEDMLRVEPEKVPLEACPGLGQTRASQIRAILRANRTGISIRPGVGQVPRLVPFEFFVDFEFFTNINVDFDRDWPNMQGCPMVFMIGVGYIRDECWHYKCFTADSETHAAESKLWQSFVSFLDEMTGGSFTDSTQCALYHWTYAEPKECERAAERHSLGAKHPILMLPWVDLNKVYLTSTCGVPGAYGTGLKEVANALGQIDPNLDPNWPGSLDQGLTAMVMGWHAYRQQDPIGSREMEILNEYLSADCRALWKVLTWMRTPERGDHSPSECQSGHRKRKIRTLGRGPK